jgi:anti-sigma factor RsiW
VQPDAHVPYETLGRYLDGSIDADEKESVERHLADCEFCRKDVADASQWQSHVAALPGAVRKPPAAARLLYAGLALLATLLLLFLLWWRFS